MSTQNQRTQDFRIGRRLAFAKVANASPDGNKGLLITPLASNPLVGQRTAGKGAWAAAIHAQRMAARGPRLAREPTSQIFEHGDPRAEAPQGDIAVTHDQRLAKRPLCHSRVKKDV